MRAAEGIVAHGGLSESIAGGVLTALGTSSPELVVTIAAIRQGALTLAVSNILGTNCFNVLIIGAADVAYRRGSIYHDISSAEVMWGLVTILMTTVLLMGMLRRQTFGIARIGFESFLMLALYAAAILMAVLAGV
jgi:cation:H+ antiporter